MVAENDKLTWSISSLNLDNTSRIINHKNSDTATILVREEFYTTIDYRNSWGQTASSGELAARSLRCPLSVDEASATGEVREGSVVRKP